ncbi:MAG: sugar ABC transporter permease [Anaerolineaceae bacterium]|jgi:multiple sugar transport system permease protein|nr:sugar ABC transporter permease [Anaerolineaceae bacterium]
MTIQAETMNSRTPASAKSQGKWRGQLASYIYVIPLLVIFGFMTIGPIITTVIYSFQKVSLGKPAEWIGLHNYVRMFGNPVFWMAWKNILEFMGLSIIMGFMVPVILSMMINEMRSLGKFFQTMVYLPSLIPIAIALMVWRQIYSPDSGFLNSFLKAIGLHGQLWLQNPLLVKPSLVVVMTWLGAGGSVLIYLSALQEIPTEIYEAAELDGFSPWQRIWFITLPLLSPRMQIMFILQIVNVGQIFTEPYILTSGGPGNHSITPVLGLYNTAFQNSDFGLASAWSVSLLLVLSLFSIVYLILSFRKEAE